MFSGLATSFFNDKNRNLVRDLLELLTEAKQEIPEWLDSMANDPRQPSGGRRGGGGKGRFGSGFGSRDYRTQSGGGGRSGGGGSGRMNNSYNNYSSGGGGEFRTDRCFSGSSRERG